MGFRKSRECSGYGARDPSRSSGRGSAGRQPLPPFRGSADRDAPAEFLGVERARSGGGGGAVRCRAWLGHLKVNMVVHIFFARDHLTSGISEYTHSRVERKG